MTLITTEKQTITKILITIFSLQGVVTLIIRISKLILKETFISQNVLKEIPTEGPYFESVMMEKS